jgi:superoxide dismutase, Cu-Zn family
MRQAVACFKGPSVKGETLFTQVPGGIHVRAFFSDLPPGKHGFHIHRAGDLRGEGCKGACDHFHKGAAMAHGGPPRARRKTRKNAPRHTGDLGNIVRGKKYSFFLSGLKLADLYGRSVIVHADPDDYGLGGHEDSKTTGHSGARIGCALIGRVSCSAAKSSKKAK